MQCTPRNSLIGGLVCCLLLMIGFGYYGRGIPILMGLALISCSSAMSNAYTLYQNDKDVVCQ